MIKTLIYPLKHLEQRLHCLDLLVIIEVVTDFLNSWSLKTFDQTFLAMWAKAWFICRKYILCIRKSNKIGGPLLGGQNWDVLICKNCCSNSYDRQNAKLHCQTYRKKRTERASIVRMRCHSPMFYVPTTYITDCDIQVGFLACHLPEWLPDGSNSSVCWTGHWGNNCVIHSPLAEVQHWQLY